MLKSILANPPPQPKTLEEAHALIKDLWQLVAKLCARVEQLEEQLVEYAAIRDKFRQLVTPSLTRQS